MIKRLHAKPPDAPDAGDEEVSAGQRYPAFSVCIVTRNRPDDLGKAIESVLASQFPVHQLIVSDDSTDDCTRKMVTARFPQVVFLEGPRRGLSANRNNALLAVSGTHVLFIDDDVTLYPDFLHKMAAYIDNLASQERVIVTGTEDNNGLYIVPHDLGFLGFQQIGHSESGSHYSIVINSTIFPAEIFSELKFDENLIYGYDEIDFASRAVCLHGYEVRLYTEARNQHSSSPINREFYAPFVEASRIYVTFKKYYWLDRRRCKALCYLPLAYGHNLVHNLKQRQTSGLASFGRTVTLSMSYIAACVRNRSRHV